MTPAIVVLQQTKCAHRVHKYHHDKQAASYGLEAAEKLNVTPEQVFKTLVAALDNGELVVAIVPVTAQLSLKHLAKVAGAKKAQMGDPNKVQRTTGYVLGGVSPLGQKKALATFIHSTASQFDTIFVSAGKRGLEIELPPSDLIALTGAKLTNLVG